MHLNFTINPVSLMKLIIEREATFRKQFRHRGQRNTENNHLYRKHNEARHANSQIDLTNQAPRENPGE